MYPHEDYELPILKCSLCYKSSTQNTIVYINDSKICYKLGQQIKVKLPNSNLDNNYLCYSCIEQVGYDFV